MRYTGTVDDLRAVRAAWRKIDQGAQAMAVLGLPGTADAQRQAAGLGASAFFVPIPCLICTRMFPEAVRVDGDSEPSSCICGDCDELTEEQIRAGHPQHRA